MSYSGISESSAHSNMVFQFYFALATHWLPVLNPMASILTNRPYIQTLLAAGRFVKIGPAAATTNAQQQQKGTGNNVVVLPARNPIIL
jgi:hypothetical protein